MPRLCSARSRDLNNRSAGNEKCSLGVCVLVIAGLSALSWGVVVLAVAAVRAVV
jgi:hypothetical protein